MTDQPRSKIIEGNPISKGLDAFRASFRLICEGANVFPTQDALEQLGQEGRQDRLASLQCAHLTTVQTFRNSCSLFYQR
jgi:hypothetical protein